MSTNNDLKTVFREHVKKITHKDPMLKEIVETHYSKKFESLSTSVSDSDEWKFADQNLVRELEDTDGSKFDGKKLSDEFVVKDLFDSRDVIYSTNHRKLDELTLMVSLKQPWAIDFCTKGWNKTCPLRVFYAYHKKKNENTWTLEPVFVDGQHRLIMALYFEQVQFRDPQSMRAICQEVENVKSVRDGYASSSTIMSLGVSYTPTFLYQKLECCRDLLKEWHHEAGSITPDMSAEVRNVVFCVSDMPAINSQLKNYIDKYAIDDAMARGTCYTKGVLQRREQYCSYLCNVVRAFKDYDGNLINRFQDVETEFITQHNRSNLDFNIPTHILKWDMILRSLPSFLLKHWESREVGRYKAARHKFLLNWYLDVIEELLSESTSDLGSSGEVKFTFTGPTSILILKYMVNIDEGRKRWDEWTKKVGLYELESKPFRFGAEFTSRVMQSRPLGNDVIRRGISRGFNFRVIQTSTSIAGSKLRKIPTIDMNRPTNLFQVGTALHSVALDLERELEREANNDSESNAPQKLGPGSSVVKPTIMTVETKCDLKTIKGEDTAAAPIVTQFTQSGDEEIVCSTSINQNEIALAAAAAAAVASDEVAADASAAAVVTSADEKVVHSDEIAAAAVAAVGSGKIAAAVVDCPNSESAHSISMVKNEFSAYDVIYGALSMLAQGEKGHGVSSAGDRPRNDGIRNDSETAAPTVAAGATVKGAHEPDPDNQKGQHASGMIATRKTTRSGAGKRKSDDSQTPETCAIDLDQVSDGSTAATKRQKMQSMITRNEIKLWDMMISWGEMLHKQQEGCRDPDSPFPDEYVLMEPTRSKTERHFLIEDHKLGPECMSRRGVMTREEERFGLSLRHSNDKKGYGVYAKRQISIAKKAENQICLPVPGTVCVLKKPVSQFKKRDLDYTLCLTDRDVSLDSFHQFQKDMITRCEGREKHKKNKQSSSESDEKRTKFLYIFKLTMSPYSIWGYVNSASNARDPTDENNRSLSNCRLVQKKFLDLLSVLKILSPSDLEKEWHHITCSLQGIYFNLVHFKINRSLKVDEELLLEYDFE